MFVKLGAVLLVIHVCSGADFDWCSLTCNGQKHTMCVYKDGGGDSCAAYKKGLTAEEKELILDYHNELRARVAAGQETTGPQPTAADMSELVWDDEVAEIAQRWVEQCEQPGGHDKCRITRDKEKVGQNYAESRGYGMSVDRKATIKDLVKSWYDEVKDMQPSLVGAYKSSGSAVIGHYTQLVWGKTTRLGCGLAHKQEGDDGAFEVRLICNYKSAGNFIGQPVYTEGETASKCAKQSTKYPGLCEAQEKGGTPESDDSASTSIDTGDASASGSASASESVSTSGSPSASAPISTSYDDSEKSVTDDGTSTLTKPTSTTNGASSSFFKPAFISSFPNKPLKLGYGKVGNSGSFDTPENLFKSMDFTGFQDLTPYQGVSGFQKIPVQFPNPPSFQSFYPLQLSPVMQYPAVGQGMGDFYSYFLNLPGQNQGNSNTASKIFRWH